MARRRPVLLVLGGSGLVGGQVVRTAAGRFEVVAPTHAELDVLDRAGVRRAVEGSQAEVVVNLAAFADVDGAEAQCGDVQGLAHRLNVDAVAGLAEACAATGRHLIHVSTDYVFDGELAARPYRETDPTNPLSWYGETKLRGEAAALALGERASVVRIEMPFTGRTAPKLDFPRLCVQRFRAGQTVLGTDDQWITPVLLDDAAEALCFVAAERVPGLLHVASSTSTTPYDFARGVAMALGLDAGLVQPTSYASFLQQRPARRPQHSWLDVGAFQRLAGPASLHSVEEALALFARQVNRED